jgi:integrase/recombinase XerD
MNQKPSGSLTLSKAIEGFVSFKTADGLSDRTIDSYQRYLQKWLEHQGDKDIARITAGKITKYLNWLRNDYVPHRFWGGKELLSPKPDKLEPKRESGEEKLRKKDGAEGTLNESKT